jgi:hypothetical protein
VRQGHRALEHVPQEGGERRQNVVAGDGKRAEAEFDERERREWLPSPPPKRDRADPQTEQEGRRHDGRGDGVAAEVVT